MAIALIFLILAGIAWEVFTEIKRIRHKRRQEENYREYKTNFKKDA